MSEDPRIGTLIGNYEVKERLGKGGFGTVYLAYHPGLERTVAIKVLDLEDEVIGKRFVREARAACQIEHPNVIDVFDLGKTKDGKHYYQMEVLEGEEFEEVIQRATAGGGQMSPQELYPYLVQICGALQAAHELGIIHRDLKPENIYVLAGPDLKVKVIDFGIARALNGLQDSLARTATGMMMGTPHYMPLEQCQGGADKISVQTDLYALGVIIYRCLSGAFPLTFNSITELVYKHMDVVPMALEDRIPGVPEALSELVMCCLSREPDQRPGSATELCERYRVAAELPLDAASFSPPNSSSAEKDRLEVAMAPTLPPTEVSSPGDPEGPMDQTRPGPSVEGSPSEEVAEEKSAGSRMPLLVAGGAGLLIVVALVIFFLFGGRAQTTGEDLPPTESMGVAPGVAVPGESPPVAPADMSRPVEPDLGPDQTWVADMEPAAAKPARPKQKRPPRHKPALVPKRKPTQDPVKPPSKTRTPEAGKERADELDLPL